VVATPSNSARCPPLPKHGGAEQDDLRDQGDEYQELHLVLHIPIPLGSAMVRQFQPGSQSARLDWWCRTSGGRGNEKLRQRGIRTQSQPYTIFGVTQENPMRYVIAATVACMLAACATPPPSQGRGCSTRHECEVQAYERAGGGA